MACGDYSNHCNKAGYYSDYFSPFSYQDNGCTINFTNTNECSQNYYVNVGLAGWTNASECGGDYYVNAYPCYQNVAFTNVETDVNHTNDPGTTPWTNFEDTYFTNTCVHVNHEDYQHENTCVWDDVYDDPSSLVRTFCNCPGSSYTNSYSNGYSWSHVPNSTCTGPCGSLEPYCQAGYNDSHSDAGCGVHCNNAVRNTGCYYTNDFGNGSGATEFGNCTYIHPDSWSDYTNYPHDNYSYSDAGWPDFWNDPAHSDHVDYADCYYNCHYSNACGVGSYDDAAAYFEDVYNECGWGYDNSYYAYANHNNVPFNNFCNHSNAAT